MHLHRRIRRRAGSLARRYGHASMAQVHETMGHVKRLARENAPIAAAVVGAGAGAVAGTLGVGTGALVGLVAGIAIEEAAKK
jgi:hypothetical protein